MTDITAWIDAAEARCKAATPGPWKYDAVENVGENWLIGVINTGVDYDWKAQHIVTTDNLHASRCTSGGAIEDAQFIAAARTDLPRALKALRMAMASLTFFGATDRVEQISAILEGRDDHS